jgi:serine/threonine protein kinase
MEDIIGKTLGRYKILALLGEGGMGAVYKAHDLTLQRDVAFKIMHPHFARQGDFKERFLQEARVAARLDHPCIVQVFDFGQTTELLYIVMKFIPGDNLGKMMQDLRTQGKWIDTGEAVGIIRVVAEAMHYAHEHSILHRDLKPGNIMIEPIAHDGLPYRPVLTDLGLAKLAGSAGLTQEGTSMGTPAYMSPEQALGETLDPRSDVYSLGILLFELSTGRLPFPARTISEAIRFHTRETPPKPRSIQPDLPEVLEEGILRCLEKDKTKRFASAAELAAFLKDCLPSTPSASITQTPLGTTVSLITQYQASLDAGRGPSVLKEFNPVKDRSQDRVQVLYADKTTKAVAIKPDGLVIGRDADSDIVVASAGVSRHHTRIDFDGTRYLVIDLNSTNGTFLENTRLLPGVSQEWEPDKALRVGDAYLRLVRGDKKALNSVVLSNGTSVEAGQVYSSPGEGRAGVCLETQQLTIQPGQAATLNAVIVNQGSVVDHFRVWVEGLPDTWTGAKPAPIQLMPGMQKNVSVKVQPPKDSKSRAGRYAFTLCTASQTMKDQVAQARGSLTLMPYYEFTSELYPQRLKAGAFGKVTVHNQGNSQEIVGLTFKDRADELIFEPPQARLTVAAGSQAVAQFRSRPKQKTFLGGQKIHPFSVQAQASQGAAQALTGEVVSRALLPAWVPPVLLMLCLLLSVGGFMVYNTITSGAEATRQAQFADSTRRMQEAVLTQQAAQGTVGAMQSKQTLAAKAGTENSATAIAWSFIATQTASSPTPTTASSETPTPSLTPTPTPPEDGFSMNCDGTFQRLRINDAGSLGKTVNLDNWTSSGWVSVFTLSSGDPMDRQFDDSTGLYKFGSCQRLLVIPTNIGGRFMQLAIYAWNGSGLTQVFYNEGTYATWTLESEGFVFDQAMYLYSEPTCCPCYRQSSSYIWNGNDFTEGATSLNPTFNGEPPPECGGPTPTPTFSLIFPTLIIIYPTP